MAGNHCNNSKVRHIPKVLAKKHLYSNFLQNLNFHLCESNGYHPSFHPFSSLTLYSSGSRAIAEDLPHVHPADGASLQVQRAEAARDLRYHRSFGWISTSFSCVGFSVWVAFVTDLTNKSSSHHQPVYITGIYFLFYHMLPTYVRALFY